MARQERLRGMKSTAGLFTGGDTRSMTVFPLRAVWRLDTRQPGEPPAKMMVSVSKRHFKHAVDRNRAKRQVREAYRKHKHLLWDALREREGQALMVAFVWQSDKPLESDYVERKLERLARKLSERL